MRLTAKVTTVLVLGIILLLVGEDYLIYRREVELLRSDMHQDAEEIGHNIEKMVLQLVQELGPEKTIQLLDKMERVDGPVSRHWVWLEAKTVDRRKPMVPLARLDRLLSMQGRQTQSFEVPDNEGVPRRVTYVEVDVGPNRIGAVELVEYPAFGPQAVARFRTRTMRQSAITLLLGGIAVTLLGHQFVSKPLKRLVEKTRRIGRGDLSGPLPVHGWDEFGELSASINSMCDQLSAARENVDRETAARIAATDQLRHVERLHTVGRLASGVAHELGTPLNVVGGRAALIASGKLSSEEVEESARIIKSESERMTKIIRQLLDFARRNHPQKYSADLREVVTDLLQLLDPLAERANYTIAVVKEASAMRAKIDLGQLQQVLTNLLMNAAQSMPEGGDIEIGFRRQRARPPGDPQAEETPYVCVYVLDEGVGISEEHRNHIFEPFFTTKEVGKGTGLGLSISYGIVREHGGWIDVQSQPGEGSCFSVFLPEEED